MKDERASYDESAARRAVTPWLAIPLGLLVSLLLGCGGSDSSRTTAVVNAAARPAQVSIAVSPGKVNSGDSATLTWSSTDTDDCVASGDWFGTQPVSGSASVIASRPGPATYRIECKGPRGTTSESAVLWVLAPPAPAGGNVQTVTLDRGPNGQAFNAPFVSVTVCAPGTSDCSTINHVLVDTGSVGLRLLASAFPRGTQLPPVQAAGDMPIAVCGQFVSGYTWGSVRRADVRLGGATAAGIPIQVIADPGPPYATIPSPCRATGFNQGSVSGLAANGILGIGMASHDCSTPCVSSTFPRYYYTCTTTGCEGAPMPLALQLTNPVLYLAENDNGFSLSLPTVPLGGSRILTGTLTYGIGSRANNQLVTTQVLKTDSKGRFTTVYNQRTYRSAFIDSGSNGILFDDAALFSCGDFYCPPAPLFPTASNRGTDGGSLETPFVIESINSFNNNSISAFHAAGFYGLSQTFDWGAPFFFGRRAFMALDGASTPAGKGPYWAY